MIKIKPKHYVDTVIYSIDMIIRNLKNELKQNVDKLGIGITAEQFMVLDTIASCDNIYQQKLSDILQKDKSNTTRILKVLEEKGLIRKEADKINNRLVYFLKITEEGKKIAKENMPIIKNMIENMFENITDEEIEILHTLSNKFQKELTRKNHH